MMSQRIHKILLVDDDQTTLRIYSDQLRQSGFDVLTAQSGEQALEILENTKVDLLITDIMMAKMDGWQLVATIREKLCIDEVKLPIIVMSAFNCAELEIKCFRHGANMWINKPIHPLDKLTKIAKKALGLAPSGYEL